MTFLRRPWSVTKLVLAAGVLAVALALSIAQGRHEHLGQDFHVFWQAGFNSATGRPLYHDSLPGARPLKFPPFAALVFQLVALFPLQVAAAFFSLLNRVLWVMVVGLMREILVCSLPGRRLLSLPHHCLQVIRTQVHARLRYARTPAAAVGCTHPISQGSAPSTMLRGDRVGMTLVIRRPAASNNW